ncbi:hypothetical protein NDI39_18935 [Microcoleus sp. ZQ-A2]|nr:hypothetical protein [Microcoleus sp. FACHB-1]
MDAAAIGLLRQEAIGTKAMRSQYFSVKTGFLLPCFFRGVKKCLVSPFLSRSDRRSSYEDFSEDEEIKGNLGRLNMTNREVWDAIAVPPLISISATLRY